MEPKLEKRNEAGGERAVEKPLRGKVHTTDFFTSIGNPPNPRISTFPQPRRRRLVIFYLEDWRTKTQTRPRPRVTYRKPKMVLTMGSTLPRLSFNKVVVTRYRIFLENRYLAAGTINGRLAAVRGSMDDLLQYDDSPMRPQTPACSVRNSPPASDV